MGSGKGRTAKDWRIKNGVIDRSLWEVQRKKSGASWRKGKKGQKDINFSLSETWPCLLGLNWLWSLQRKNQNSERNGEGKKWNYSANSRRWCWNRCWPKWINSWERSDISYPTNFWETAKQPWQHKGCWTSFKRIKIYRKEQNWVKRCNY